MKRVSKATLQPKNKLKIDQMLPWLLQVLQGKNCNQYIKQQHITRVEKKTISGKQQLCVVVY